ncbi:MAG: AMP nucleosidase, partial [Planktomarina sp.]|nr:AMP nucleosidase [Planktomarina sp.]
MQVPDPVFTLPDDAAPQSFAQAPDAVTHLIELYEKASGFLCEKFISVLESGDSSTRYRAFYPEVRITTSSYASVDSRLSYGHVYGPGVFSTTITQPRLFRNYLEQQLGLLIANHGCAVQVGYSTTPIPVHFAVAHDPSLVVPADAAGFVLRDVFDVPDLATTNDNIVNGTDVAQPDGSQPLALFDAQRVDYALARLRHYTATDPKFFQNHILFTNYQFYVEEFEAFAREQMADPNSGYLTFVGPDNHYITAADAPLQAPQKMPQMPTYHLTRADGSGITLVNIGVGPSNAKTATDHIAVLRPHAWIMVGHCAGLRNSQSLGDFVLAHAYLREDHVLDDDLPIWVPIPALAE